MKQRETTSYYKSTEARESSREIVVILTHLFLLGEEYNNGLNNEPFRLTLSAVALTFLWI